MSVTRCPSRISQYAQDKPTKPAPRTATSAIQFFQLVADDDGRSDMMCPPELRFEVRGAAGQRRLDAAILTQRFFVRNNIFFVWTWVFPLKPLGRSGRAGQSDPLRLLKRFSMW